jgi:hypothetical protein
MTDDRPDGGLPERETRQQAQLRLLRARWGDRITAWPASDGTDGAAFLCETGRVLVRDEYAVQAQSQLAGAQISVRQDPEARQLDGLTVLEVGDVTRALEVIDRTIGTGVASPNHLVHISPNGSGRGVGSMCPATEPIPVPADTPPNPGIAHDQEAGRGVRVVVADTGLDPTAENRSTWLAGVTGDDDKGAGEEPLTEYAGHGTFIAGIIRCLAPAAEVHVRATFGIGGAVFENDLVGGLIDILDNDTPDIISLSAGTWTKTSGDLLSLQLFGRRRLRLHKGVLLVAAAGNDGKRFQFWPAAAPYTVSVGALDKTLTGRAWFSNFGHWVDAYAPGEDLVNAFPVGSYIGQEEDNAGVPFKYEGMARWSGTSFATPVVAGMTAARMSRTGENGVRAAAELLKLARKQAIPGLGAVLRPGGPTTVG